MTDSIDEMRKQVEERVAAEATQLPAPDERPAITSKLINDCLFANALGDATLYAALFRDRFLYVKDMKEWFEWNGHHWQRDIMDRSLSAVEKVVDLYLDEYRRAGSDMADLLKAGKGPKDETMIKLKDRQDFLLKRVSQLRDDRRRTACLKFAHTIDEPLAVKGESLDLRPMLLPCANGVIDLETGRLKPGRPADCLSMASPVEFTGIDTPAPLWEKSLLEIFGGNPQKPQTAAENEAALCLIAYLQRLLGYAVTGFVKEKIFPVLYGKTGWNGRSLIVETIIHIMGDLAGPIQSEMLLSQKFSKSASGPSPDIMTLKGLRIAFASETEENQRFSASRIKWLTGKDQLTGRWPNDKRPIRFDPTHTLFLMTNYQPKAPPNDRAFWERLHLIPFNVSFVKRDPQEPHERRANLDLDRQIVPEYSGVLAWLIRGCLLYQRDGINPPRAVTEATEKYRRNEDLLADFIDQCCTLDPGAKSKSSVLYNSFIVWYHENIGKDEPSGTWFGTQLHQKFDREKSNGHNIYLGIKLADVQGRLDSYND